MSKKNILEEIENKHRNDCLFSFDDLDSSQFLTIFVDEYEQNDEDLDDEERQIALERRVIFGE